MVIDPIKVSGSVHTQTASPTTTWLTRKYNNNNHCVWWILSRLCLTVHTHSNQQNEYTNTHAHTQPCKAHFWGQFAFLLLFYVWAAPSVTSEGFPRNYSHIFDVNFRARAITQLDQNRATPCRGVVAAVRLCVWPDVLISVLLFPNGNECLLPPWCAPGVNPSPRRGATPRYAKNTKTTNAKALHHYVTIERNFCVGGNWFDQLGFSARGTREERIFIYIILYCKGNDRHF